MVVTGPPNPTSYNRPSRFLNSRIQVNECLFVMYSVSQQYNVDGFCLLKIRHRLTFLYSFSFNFLFLRKFTYHNVTYVAVLSCIIDICTCVYCTCELDLPI